MKTLLTLTAVMGFACSVQGAVVLINCGADATGTNGYNAMTGLGSFTNLVYNDGRTNSGYGITYELRSGGSGPAEVTSGAGISSALSNDSSKGINDAWYQATGSSVTDFTGSGLGYKNSTSTSPGAQFTLTGLTAGKTYTLYILHGVGASGSSGVAGNIVFQDLVNPVDPSAVFTEINGSSGTISPNGGFTYGSYADLNVKELSFGSSVQNYTALTFSVLDGRSQLRFRFSSGSQYAIQGIALVDDTRLAIPETSTAALGLLGLMGWTLRRRR